MGMPISNYTVVNALADGRRSEHDFEFQTAVDVLKPFKLFAFVVHDPTAHPIFHKRISEIFDSLDSATGRDFLFFALVNPPERWLERSANRDYYREFQSRDWQAYRLLEPTNAIKSRDESTAAYSIATSLKIPFEDLPCLVMTDDFQKRESTWVKTCPQHIFEQLGRLGHIATYGAPSRLDGFRHELDLCGGSGAERLVSSLAKALSDVLSFLLARTNDSRYPQAGARARGSLGELRNDLKELKANFDDSKTKELDDLCLKIGSFLTHLNNRRNKDLDNFISSNENYLEQESKTFLKTAHGVLNGLHQQDDFSPGIICLTKAFEREINLSAVHWIRNELGIELPKYFNKLAPTGPAKCQCSLPHGIDIIVDFNKGRRRRHEKGRRRRHETKWIPPGIGESKHAYKSMTERHGARLPIPVEKHRRLLTNWNNIAQLRNDAAHYEIMEKRSVLTVMKAMMDLSNHAVFESLSDMKSRFSE